MRFNIPYQTFYLPLFLKIDDLINERWVFPWFCITLRLFQSDNISCSLFYDHISHCRKQSNKRCFSGTRRAGQNISLHKRS